MPKENLRILESMRCGTPNRFRVIHIKIVQSDNAFVMSMEVM